MDNLFGIPLSQYLIALSLLVILIFAFLAFVWFRNPLVVRMGLRNVVRRKTQTVLIVVGLMLSTLIVSAAFATGDTVGYSITNEVYRGFSGADLVLAFDRDRAEPGVTGLTDGDVDALRSALANDPDVQGVGGIVQTTVPALNQAERRAEPLAMFAGVDPANIDVFQGLVAPDGSLRDASVLGEDRVYVTERLAETIGIGEGDRFTIYYENEPIELVAAGVVRDNAMTGGEGQEQSAPAGGLVTSIDRWREITREGERVDIIVIAALGSVRGDLNVIDAVHDRVDAFLETSDVPAQVIATKSQMVALAELVGSGIMSIFIIFGLFSIAAGIMLIFLTFVMLAAERRSEMGMARAVGMRRTHLTESFIAEGMAYNLGSALVGALLGVGVAFALVLALRQLFADFGFAIDFNVNPQGFAIAYFLGVVITFATVAFSSWRAANLNIVAAIRDLPDTETLRSHDRSIGRIARAMVGVLWTLAFIVLIGIWSVAAFLFFTIGIATYGLGMLAGVTLGAAYVWGSSQVNRPWRSKRTVGKAGYVAWFAVFNVLAFVTWLLYRTRGWAARHRNAGGWAAWMLIIGLLAIWWGGWVAQQAFAYTAGTTLVIFAVAMLAAYFGARARFVFTVASLLSLWYWLLPLPFSLFVDDASRFFDPLYELTTWLGIGPGEELQGNIEMFFVSGIAITASATIFVIFNAERLLGSVGLLTRVLGGLTPAVRTAISYPLAARFRTGMTLAMFGLVVFSLVVMSTLNYNFTQLFIGEDAKGGFDVSASANPSNRIPDLRAALEESDFAAEGEITGIGTLRTAVAELRLAGSDAEFDSYRMQGADEQFTNLARFPLATRAAGYDSDEAVMEALRTDPTVAVVDASRAAPPEPFGPPNASDFRLDRYLPQLQEAPWDPIPVTVRNPETGAETEVRVIGVLQPQVTGVTLAWAAMFTNQSVVNEILGGGDTESFYLTTDDPSISTTVEVASSIEAALLERGVVARSIQQTIDDAAGISNSISYLFEGFMALGLIVGIAALGVISFRTVAERRQQIGMMRAIGYRRRLIGLSFFLESSFIALTGIGIGLVLGSALSYNLLSNPELIGAGGTDVHFQLPWLRLLLVVGVAYGASALMTLIPARSASRVPVAEALRYE